jgi:hypothetical protein
VRTTRFKVPGEGSSFTISVAPRRSRSTRRTPWAPPTAR